MNRTQDTILTGDNETTVHYLTAPSDGPTAVVVGGVHGNETAGINAAEAITQWAISRGKVIVIPRANKRACDRGTRQAAGSSDLNRQFPTGRQPQGTVATELWEEITRHDPDYVFDLHRSVGLYQREPDGVGMAIYPTPSGRGIAEDALGHLNADHVPDGNAGFRVGNDQDGRNPLLSHKVGGDLDPDTIGWLVETTSHNQSLSTRVEQLEHGVETLLYHADDGNGITVDEYRYGGGDTDPPTGILDHEAPLRGYHRTIGGSAGKGTHGGDVPKPDGMPSRSEADYHVRDYDQLRAALDDEDSIIYIDADIDVTGKDPIWAAGGNTLVGQFCDPSVPGSGNRIHYDDLPRGGETGVIRQSEGEPLKLYGVYFQGPLEEFTDEDHTDPDFEGTLRTGVWIHTPEDAGTFEAVGCRFSGWTWSGIQLGNHRNRTDAEIRRCTIEMCNYQHYGYGVCSYDADLFIDRCFFDNCRHATAGYGRPTEEHDITNSVMGPGPGASHAWDLHGLRENSSTDSLVAGGHLRMKNCTTMQTETFGGNPQEGVKIRGIPDEISWFRDCHWYHDEEPSRSNPGANQAIRQDAVDDWTNVELFDDDENGGNNYYGSDDSPDGVGAPLAEQDREPENGETTMDHPFQRLMIHGGSSRCDYKLLVDGAAETVEDESKDSVESVDTGTILSGLVYKNYHDEYHIAPDAEIVKATFDGSCTVAIDGQTAQLGSAIASGLADEDFEL